MVTNDDIGLSHCAFRLTNAALHQRYQLGEIIQFEVMAKIVRTHTFHVDLECSDVAYPGNVARQKYQWQAYFGPCYYRSTWAISAYFA